MMPSEEEEEAPPPPAEIRSDQLHDRDRQDDDDDDDAEVGGGGNANKRGEEAVSVGGGAIKQGMEMEAVSENATQRTQEDDDPEIGGRPVKQAKQTILVGGGPIKQGIDAASENATQQTKEDDDPVIGGRPVKQAKQTILVGGGPIKQGIDAASENATQQTKEDDDPVIGGRPVKQAKQTILVGGGPIKKGMEAVSENATQRTPRTENETSSGSFVSLNSSNIGIDGASADGLFNVASGSIGRDPPPSHWRRSLGIGLEIEEEEEEGGIEEERDSLRGDNMPRHWHWKGSGGSASSGDRQTPTRGILSSYGRSPAFAGKVPASFRASTSSEDDFSVGGISVSVRSVESSGSSKLWDQMEANKRRMEATNRRLNRLMEAPLTERKKRAERRRMYVRRCAKAMGVFVALAALSASAVYLVAIEDLGSILDALPALPDAGALWSGLLGDGGGDSSGGGEESGLRYRKLPQGGGIVEMTGGGPEDDLSPRERKHVGRGRRIRERERRAAEGRAGAVHRQAREARFLRGGGVADETAVLDPPGEVKRNLAAVVPAEYRLDQNKEEVVSLEEMNRRAHLLEERWNGN